MTRAQSHRKRLTFMTIHLRHTVTNPKVAQWPQHTYTRTRSRTRCSRETSYQYSSNARRGRTGDRRSPIPREGRHTTNTTHDAGWWRESRGACPSKRKSEEEGERVERERRRERVKRLSERETEIERVCDVATNLALSRRVPSLGLLLPSLLTSEPHIRVHFDVFVNTR